MKSTKMLDREALAPYLMRLSQVRDELATITKTVLYYKMVRISLKGFTKEWKPFIKGIIARLEQVMG